MLPTDLKLLGMTEIELKKNFGKPDVIDLDTDLLILTRMYPDEEEWTYFLNQSYWGMFSKRLHLYLSKGKVVDCYTSMYIIDLCIG